MKVGSFCTGYGGLDLAVEQYYNAELSWVSEIDNNCNKLLEKRFNKPNLGDLTSVNWEDVEPVDIICAGFPCQPFSDAGSKKGDKDERAIFPLVAESIGVLRPRYVFLENVAGITTTRNGGGLDVVGLLTQMGYDCRWGIIRASDIGACHQRARWFCVASDPNSDREGGGQTGTVREQGNNERQINEVRPDRSSSLPENSNDRGSSERQTGTVQGTSGGQDQFQRERRQDGGDTVRLGGSSDLPASDSDSSRLQQQCGSITMEERHRTPERDSCEIDWGKYTGAIRRWSETIGRPPPPPAKDLKLSSSFVEWMMGLPEGWVCDLGLPRTVELKMLGNGVVPQQALLALELLNE